ncbi:putative DNA polymerase III beta subunit [Xenorhabdus bovienii str. puntauvense]|uniref:Putative DNA polymerase III beta subunit n=1 Tax=Xenorhabdus bovienii str. puntauvense TaxID=1398201 RepID=A0A077NKZ2_XENBV|nr:hypothetical protein [Xenorhabdus bovienii]CDG98570.1 putative DNA polymerase III beta subunit [Xenorhabdus bovienii str. puntauvense]
MKLKINRGTLLAILECQAIRDPCTYLCGICFRPDGKVAATDGFMLAYGKHENEIEREVIVSIGKLPTKNFEYAKFDTEQGIVRLFDKQNKLIGATLCSEIDGEFPHIDRLINEAELAINHGITEISFSLGLLARLEKMAKYLNSKHPFIKIKTTSATGAALCNIYCPFYGAINVLIMPARI